jgi:hypothetical protein
VALQHLAQSGLMLGMAAWGHRDGCTSNVVADISLLTWKFKGKVLDFCLIMSANWILPLIQ